MSVRGSYSKLFLLLVHALEPVLPPTDNNMTLSQTDTFLQCSGLRLFSSFPPFFLSFLLFWHSHQTVCLKSVPNPGNVKPSGSSRTHSCLLSCLFFFHSMSKAVSSAFKHFPADCFRTTLLSAHLSEHVTVLPPTSSHWPVEG